MDKQLTLAMQYEANRAGIALPWEKIGARMDEQITGGAVIQHLAKMRARLVEQGEPVPPSLRRGGGTSRAPTNTTSVTTMVKHSPNKKATPSKSKSAKSKKASKKASPGSDDSDEDDDWMQDESDADYGQSPTKRAKRTAKGATRPKYKGDETDEEAGISIDASMGKRKRQNKKSSSQDLSAYGTTDINGVPIDDYSDAEQDIKAEVVATGSPWLSLDEDAGQRKNGKEVVLRKSLVVSLPSNSNKTGMTGTIKDEAADVGVDDDSQFLSNQEIEQAFNTPQPNQDYDGLAAAQLNSGYDGLPNDNTDSYQLGSAHSAPFNGEHHGQQPVTNDLNTLFNNSSPFQTSGGLINNHETLQDQTAGLSGGYYDNTGGDFGLDSTDFSGQNAGGTLGMDSTTFNGQNAGGFDGSYTGVIPFPLQTSWPNNHGSMMPSSNTSLNQTPAAPSASTDFSGGYFNSHQNGYQAFNDGMDTTLFDTGNFDESFGNGGWFDTGSYGN